MYIIVRLWSNSKDMYEYISHTTYIVEVSCCFNLHNDLNETVS